MICRGWTHDSTCSANRSRVDEHWPEGIFPTLADDIDRDTGPRIVSLLRWVDRLRAASEALARVEALRDRWQQRGQFDDHHAALELSRALTPPTGTKAKIVDVAVVPPTEHFGAQSTGTDAGHETSGGVERCVGRVGLATDRGPRCIGPAGHHGRHYS